MSIKSFHPSFSELASRWQVCRDSYGGEHCIKSRGRDYLPATSGQIQDGADVSAVSPGAKSYESYKLRAVYPDIYRDAVEAAIGVMHRKPPIITLPAALEPMRDNATLLGESLEMLLRRINARQLITGRLGLLGDIRVENGVDRPVIAIYNEMSIRNWNDTSDEDADIDLRLVVLDESGYRMNADLDWDFDNRYRVLGLVDENGTLSQFGRYASTVMGEGEEISSAEFISPSIRGSVLSRIPFVFVNSKDLSPEPDRPPLEGLANLCLSIYRGEADYRQHLFMQSQDTLVTIGAGMLDDEESVRTGAGARIDVPMGGDAKYIGVASQGLPEQRQALENDYSRAIQKSGQLIDATSRAKESGDALRIRVAAQTATLPQIARTGAAGLESILRDLAVWYGANPDAVSVQPNLNFTESELGGSDLVEIMQAKALGAPLSYESVHAIMRDNGITKMNYDEELELIANQESEPGYSLSSPVDRE